MTSDDEKGVMTVLRRVGLGKRERDVDRSEDCPLVRFPLFLGCCGVCIAQSFMILCVIWKS